MDVTQEEALAEKVLNEYPTPIAQACEPLFDQENRLTCPAINKAFDTIWSFLGSMATALYINVGAPSLKINLYLMTSIRTMNQERWVRIFKQIIPSLSGAEFLPGLLAFYRVTFPREGNPVDSFQRFKKRIDVKFLPPDSVELAQARTQILNMLDSLEFLTGVSLVAADDTGVFQLRGIEKEPMENPPDLKPGQVSLMDNSNGHLLSLIPFMKTSSGGDMVQFTDFKDDQEAYKHIIRNRSIAEDVQEYQNLLSAKPVLEISEKSAELLVPLDDLKEVLNELLASDENQRVLIESYPGGGKTLLAARIEDILDTRRFKVVKYFLESEHMAASMTIFSRFFYQKLNECLDKPYATTLKGDEWNKFKENVLTDFVKGNKKLVLVIDAVESGMIPIPGEKVSVEEFLGMDLPLNLKVIFTSRTGLYPRKFDKRLVLLPLTLEQMEPVFSQNEEKREAIERMWKFYGGQRGYINDVLRAGIVNGNEIPRDIIRNFSSILFTFNYFNPIREQILRYMAQMDRPLTLDKISVDLDISAPVVLETLTELMPIVRVSKDGDTILYELFIPAFADFIRNYEKYTF